VSKKPKLKTSRAGKIAVSIGKSGAFRGSVTITAKTRSEKHPSSYASSPFKPIEGENLWDAARRTLGQAHRDLKQIKVGRRHRKEYGDLKALARSIDARGLLQPVVITPENKLIAGDRRLRAWPLTKFRDNPIPVVVVDIDSIVAGEWDENKIRKDFTPSEQVAIKRELEAALKIDARHRRREHGGTAPGRKSDKADATARAGDQAAKLVGKGRRTLEKAEHIVVAAEKDPKRFGKLKADMDRTGRVDGPFKRLQNMQQGDAIKKSPSPLPGKGPYQAIVIDPPWPQEAEADQETIDAHGRSLRPYPAMSIQALCAFMTEEVKPILAENCSVGLWVTNHHMRHAFALLHALGIDQHSTIVTWGKDKFGRGQVRRDKTEHCIIGFLGKPVLTLTNQTTLLQAARRENSQKPDEFYAEFEAVHPAPRYAEIFSRGGRNDKWDCHGDQTEKFNAPKKKSAKLKPTPIEKAIMQADAESEDHTDQPTADEPAATAPAGNGDKSAKSAAIPAGDSEQLKISGFLDRNAPAAEAAE
jgi:N6-adenosine-specific RNA methylase IME4